MHYIVWKPVREFPGMLTSVFCFVLFFLAPSMLDLAKLVEVTPQQAPCHPQTLADHTRHFRHHLLMVSADIMPLFGD